MAVEKITAASLRESKTPLIVEARSLADLGEAATDEQKAKGEELVNKVLAIEERAARLERIEKLEAEQSASAGVVSADSPLNPKNTRNGKHQYLVSRAVLQWNKYNGQLKGFERECSQHVAQQSGKTPKGFFMPLDAGVEKRDISGGLNVTTGANAQSIAVADTVIEQLRAKTISGMLGVQTLTGVKGTFRLPKQSSLAQIFWVGAGEEVGAGGAAIQKQVEFNPKTVGTWMDISRRFLSMSELDGEAWVRNEIFSGLALGVDRAVFQGGIGTDEDEPVGVLGFPEAQILKFGATSTTGGLPTWAKIVEMETKAEIANALNLGSGDQFAYVLPPGLKGVLKTTTKISSSQYSDFIYGSDGRVNGYKAVSSNQLPANLAIASGDTGLSAMVFGHFPSITVAYYTGLDIIPDNITGAKAGTIRVTVLQDCDIQSRYDEAFVVAKDIKLA